MIIKNTYLKYNLKCNVFIASGYIDIDLISILHQTHGHIVHTSFHHVIINHTFIICSPKNKDFLRLAHFCMYLYMEDFYVYNSICWLYLGNRWLNVFNWKSLANYYNLKWTLFGELSQARTLRSRHSYCESKWLVKLEITK